MDRGTNLLSHLMKDLCELLGITKLNTTAYHPECDGMVERFNRTLKTMHASRFRNQWDRYLSSMLWAYTNVPHDSTGEKPSFLLFGWDLQTPTEAALMKPSQLTPTSAEDYREEVILSLTSACELATESIRKAQKRYKDLYDRKTKQVDYQVGDWVFIKFPAEETGPNRKLSSPRHGQDPDVTATKVYFPHERQIQVHQQRVTSCPPALVTGYYWYGPKKYSDGKVPQWVEKLMKADESGVQVGDADELDDEEAISMKVTEDEEPDNNAATEISDAVILEDTRQRNTPNGCPYSVRKKISVPRSTAKLGMSFRRGGVM